MKTSAEWSTVYFRLNQNYVHVISPALAGYDAFLQELIVFVCADGEPVTQLSIIQGVHHFKYLSSGEGQALRKLFLVLKMSSDEEVIPSSRCQDVFIY